jgi:hypothetical protein
MKTVSLYLKIENKLSCIAQDEVVLFFFRFSEQLEAMFGEKTECASWDEHKKYKPHNIEVITVVFTMVNPLL